MNPDRWTFRWIVIVPFLVGALISHRWKMVLPLGRSARTPTSKINYLPTEKEPIKIGQFLPTERPAYHSLLVEATYSRLDEPLTLLIVSKLDPLYGLMSLQL